VPISAASTPSCWYFSTSWSSVRSGNAGSETPIGIFRRLCGVEDASSSDCATADMPRGAATAPANTPPVVARKLLRVGESGSEEFDIKLLDVESKNRTLYAESI